MSCLQHTLTVWAGQVTINILPDDVLVHIFLIDGLEYGDEGLVFLEQPTVQTAEDGDRVKRLPWTWHRLVHVCSRWRSIVFASPNFLDLRLVCSPMTRMELTGIWPPLPIIITNAVKGWHGYLAGQDYDFDAAIVDSNRVREISLTNLSGLLVQRLASATRMQEQFPALTHLALTYHHSTGPVPTLPDGFLGGSAPRLLSIRLDSIPFPGLPKLLLSATHLVRLILWRVPHSGYFSPEKIVTGLAVMANLKSLTIRFESPQSRPHRGSRRLTLPTRTVLPALTRFDFNGASEYLEDLVARIDAPLLDSIDITFFHQLIYNIPQLAQFMGRATRFQEFKVASLYFSSHSVHVWTFSPTPAMSDFRILCRHLDWQLSSLAQVLASYVPSTDMVEDFYIHNFSIETVDVEHTQWLEIFHLFTGVKNLYLSEIYAPRIASALQELVGGRRTEVLPILQHIYLEGLKPSEPIQEGIGKFVAARQLSGHPITVSRWGRP